MKKSVIGLVLIAIFFVYLIQNSVAEPFEENYGIVNAWFNNEEATVENIQLKIGEPAEIKVKVTSKIDGHVFVKLINPLVSDSYEIISGPSIMDKSIDNLNVKSGWTETYVWTIKPTGEWKNGNAPINIFVEFSKAYDDDEHIKFTIANPYILDEQYSSPASSGTDAAPSSDGGAGSEGLPGFGAAGALIAVAAAVGVKRKL